MSPGSSISGAPTAPSSSAPDAPRRSISRRSERFPSCCSTAIRNWGGGGLVYSDAASIARAAARELMASGIDDFAFIPYPEDARWNQRRGEEFARIVRQNGKRFHLLENVPWTKLVQSLAEQLKRLPRPCGVLAVNDDVAREALVACEAAGIDVPGDIAVVGVDNDVEICENTSVTLSSVAIDYLASGRLAAQLLADRMAHPASKPSSRTFGVWTLVRRASTRRCHDRRISAALEKIRREACSKVTSAQVAQAMGVSRRHADLLFTATVGHPIFEEIRAVRIARVKEMLANPRQELAALPDFCGYGSLAELCRDFRRATGMTMSDWRKHSDIRK
jgi:LacI family transcriptional regulator